jgi:UDP-N-acetylglucosamine--N-acetylmuramyl-(pentapeptide) pyrophosphoryl-undecaprenol N-acetylglucosamine transferase
MALNRVIVMAGGTGGHVFPALAVASQLRAREFDVRWLGSRHGLEARVVPAADIALYRLVAQGLRGKRAYAWVVAPFWLVVALLQALFIFVWVRPAAVLGMGGFVTGPGGVAAWLLRRPLLIHEQNAVLGLTNRWLAPLASAVMEGFPGTVPGRYRPTPTGNPVRAEIAAIPHPEARLRPRTGPLHVLVLGGSQGAQVLNEVLPEALTLMAAELHPEVWHQTGTEHIAATRERYRRAGMEARLMPFIQDMAEAYAWADLVVCRAGALTVAELAAAGVGAVLVPYPYAVDDHQTRNAEYLVRAGAAVLLPQLQLSARRLSTLLSDLSRNRDCLLQMAVSARRCAEPQATTQVVELICTAAGCAQQVMADPSAQGPSIHA